MIMRLEIMWIVSVIVRLESVSGVLMLVPVFARSVFVRMRVLMEVGMLMLVHMFVRMRHLAVSMLMAMAVRMQVAVVMTMSVVCIHRASPLRPLCFPPSMP
jgi:hypothetical protein